MKEYTDFQMQKLRSLAIFQSTCSIYDVCLEYEGQDCNDPWYDMTGRFDVDPVEYYGEEFFGKWCELASQYITEHAEDRF